MAILDPLLRPASPFPKRPVRSLKIDEELVVRSVLDRANQILNDRDRGKWMEDRLLRYAKYRGYLQEKTFPWTNCSNAHLPILQTAELRANAGIYNAVFGRRPVVSAKARRRGDIEKEDHITDLIDTQLFVDPGPHAERRIGDLISNFFQDGNAVAYTPWVRDERTVTHIVHRPPIPDGQAPSDYLESLFTELFEGTISRIELHETVNNRFFVTYRLPREERDETAQVDVYTDHEDDALELVITREATVYDGPIQQNIPIGNLLVPWRCENLQPPSEDNPNGAPYVFLLLSYRLDELKRLRAQGRLNWLTDEGFERIVAVTRSNMALLGASAKPEAALEEQKDQIEGRAPLDPDVTAAEEAVGHLPVPMILAFDRWDLGGDAAEDVVWMVARDAKVLCEARRLTDRWPADRPYRPLAEGVCIPVPGRWYGISLLELGEALYDLIKGTFDQAFDGASITTLPFFFYGASSKFNVDPIKLAPGHGYPVPGDPRQTVYIPTWPQQPTAFASAIIGMGMQMFQAQMAQGPLQQGQVPTGKASALRTVGTTSALLQQGDVRADQLLLRFFNLLGQIAANFHRMNRHLLPKGKEIRILGWDGEREQGYRTLTIRDIDAEADFEFRPDFLNSNPQMLASAIQSVMQIAATPLAFQSQIVTPQHLYNLIRDYVRGLRLDAKRYLQPPSRQTAPGLLWEEAIDLVLRGQAPIGVPLEGADVHMKKAFEFINSDQMGLLSPMQTGLLRAWLDSVGQQLQQERLIQSAQQFQSQQQAMAPAGVATTAAEPQTPGAAPPMGGPMGGT